jgi:hypothetical protein
VTVTVPLVVCAPLQALLAVHEVALVEDHVSVALCPSVIEVGATDRVTVGAGATTAFTVTETEALPLPPAPLQLKL